MIRALNRLLARLNSRAERSRHQAASRVLTEQHKRDLRRL